MKSNEQYVSTRERDWVWPDIKREMGFHTAEAAEGGSGGLTNNYFHHLLFCNHNLSDF